MMISFRTGFICLLGIFLVFAYAGCGLPSSFPVAHLPPSPQTQQNTVVDPTDHLDAKIVSEDPQHLEETDLTVTSADGSENVFRVQVAGTEETRSKGLMFRTSMLQDEGMIFLFEHEGPLSFWMKNTLIPLDMIFVDASWKVVSIQKNAQPCKADPCVLYPSSRNAKYVLEINAGLSDKLSIVEGSQVKF